MRNTGARRASCLWQRYFAAEAFRAEELVQLARQLLLDIHRNQHAAKAARAGAATRGTFSAQTTWRRPPSTHQVMSTVPLSELERAVTCALVASS
jgi:hypothetical protein